MIHFKNYNGFQKHYMYLYFVLTPIHLKALCLLENSQSDGAHHLHTILCIHLLTLIKNMIKVFFLHQFAVITNQYCLFRHIVG